MTDLNENKILKERIDELHIRAESAHQKIASNYEKLDELSKKCFIQFSDEWDMTIRFNRSLIDNIQSVLIKIGKELIKLGEEK
jgi:hypothetical protein